MAEIAEQLIMMTGKVPEQLKALLKRLSREELELILEPDWLEERAERRAARTQISTDVSPLLSCSFIFVHYISYKRKYSTFSLVGHNEPDFTSSDFSKTRARHGCRRTRGEILVNGTAFRMNVKVRESERRE